MTAQGRISGPNPAVREFGAYGVPLVDEIIEPVRAETRHG